jgi:hypothetical protein
MPTQYQIALAATVEVLDILGILRLVIQLLLIIVGEMEELVQQHVPKVAFGQTKAPVVMVMSYQTIQKKQNPCRNKVLLFKPLDICGIYLVAK